MIKLLDLSGKIDQLTVRLYEVLTSVASSLGVPFFVVGATARDTILEHGFGIQSRRATKDVDIGVRVSNWNEFERLREALLNTSEFAETRGMQRLSYRGELPVDIVPFGGIADTDRKISWPPEKDIIMSTVGFEEAYGAAQRVRITADPPLEILVASPAGLAIMKMVAWEDRPEVRSKDARDLAHILETYLDAGNSERLFEEHEDLTNTGSFDYVRAGARILGRDIGSIVRPETRARIQETLQRETSEGCRYLLVQQIVQASALSGHEERRFDEVIACLKELSAGIDEGYRR